MVHQPPGQRGAGVDEVPGRAHLPGAPQPDGLDEQDRQAPAGHDADTRVGVGERRPVGRDEEVAVERHLETTGDRRAVHRADEQLRVRRERAAERELAEAVPAVRVVRAVGGLVERAPTVGELLEVDAGAERGIGAGQDHHVDVVARLAVADGPRDARRRARR